MKLLLNSALIALGTKYVTADIKNFYLEISLKDKQCVPMHAELDPKEMTQTHNLQSKTHTKKKNHMHINKGIHSLKKVGTLAKKQL